MQHQTKSKLTSIEKSNKSKSTAAMAIEHLVGSIGGAVPSCSAHQPHTHTSFVPTYSHWATYNDPYPAQLATDVSHEAISVAKQTATTADNAYVTFLFCHSWLQIFISSFDFELTNPKSLNSQFFTVRLDNVSLALNHMLHANERLGFAQFPMTSSAGPAVLAAAVCISECQQFLRKPSTSGDFL